MEKEFEEQVGKKLWKEFTRKECFHYNEVGKKMILIFFILVVLPKIKLWTWWN